MKCWSQGLFPDEGVYPCTVPGSQGSRDVGSPTVPGLGTRNVHEMSEPDDLGSAGVDDRSGQEVDLLWGKWWSGPDMRRGGLSWTSG